MELGNLMFGNSRGEVPVPRGKGYEEELGRLFDAVNGKRDTSWRDYGVDFENEIFSTFPYYWGDCTCEFDEKELKWNEQNRHSRGCYQALYGAHMALVDLALGLPVFSGLTDVFDIQSEEENGIFAFTLTPKNTSQENYELHRSEDERIRRELCKKFDISWDNGKGSAAHCTCEYDTKWEKWASENGHDSKCPITRPNFHYKSSDYRLDWYKYPLRDSYANRTLTLPQFRKMMDTCIASIAK